MGLSKTKKIRQLEMLRTRIGILERAGQEGIADRLRDEIRDIENGIVTEQAEEESTATSAAEMEASDLETSVISAFPTLKRRLLSLGIVSLADFQHWNHRRLKLCRFADAEIALIYATMASLGLGRVLASAVVPLTFPDPYPYAFDLLAGRTREDCDRYLDMLADGVPQRRVSQLMGSAFGWHQVAGSLADRLSFPLAAKVLTRFDEMYRRAPWYLGAEVTRVPGARKRAGGIAVSSTLAARESARACDAARLNERRRGAAAWSWRGVSLLFSVQTTSQRDKPLV